MRYIFSLIFCFILRGLLIGQVCFNPAVNYSTSPSSFFITKGDFNKDGNTDLATANNNSGDMSVLIGDGMGNFSTYTYTTVACNFGITSADFNNDGNLDLGMVSQTASFTHSINIMLNNGMGSFSSVGCFPTGTAPVYLVSADFNGDGNADIITGNQSYDVYLHLGDGSGGFTIAGIYTVGATPYSMKAADVNADGKPDLVTSNFYPGNIAVFLNNGAGGFSAPTFFNTGSSPNGFCILDFDNDGKLDVLTGRSNYGMAFLKGLGNGNFTAPVNFTTPVSVNDIFPGDFNGDGKTDVAFTSYYSSIVSVMLGDNTGNFTYLNTDFPVGKTPYRIVSADFNNDGRPDVATSNITQANVSILLNTPYSITASSSAPAVCLGNTVTVNVAGAGTYTWSAGLSNGSPFTPTASAVYTVTGTDTLSGCHATASVAIIVNTNPTLNVTASNTFVCLGKSTTLNASGATSYTWSPGTFPSSSSVNAYPSSNTIYTVSGTSAGCPLADTRTIAVNVNTVLPTVNVSSSTSTLCTGQTATLNASGAVSYTWNTGSVSQAISVSPTITTNYTVYGSGTNGCSSAAIITQSVNTCAGIEELLPPESWSFYPNPSRGEATIISGDFPVSVVIFSSTGQKLREYDLPSNSHRNITGLAPGLYFIRARDGKACKLIVSSP